MTKEDIKKKWDNVLPAAGDIYLQGGKPIMHSGDSSLFTDPWPGHETRMPIMLTDEVMESIGEAIRDLSGHKWNFFFNGIIVMSIDQIGTVWIGGVMVPGPPCFFLHVLQQLYRWQTGQEFTIDHKKL